VPNLCIAHDRAAACFRCGPSTPTKLRGPDLDDLGFNRRNGLAVDLNRSPTVLAYIPPALNPATMRSAVA
jgi:hypothetical protein